MDTSFSFEAWLKEGCPQLLKLEGVKSTTDWEAISLKSFLCDDKGKLLVDFVYRYERLQQDFNEICKRIGMRPKKLPRQAASGKKVDQRRWFTPQLRTLAEDICREDLEMFYP